MLFGKGNGFSLSAAQAHAGGQRSRNFGNRLRRPSHAFQKNLRQFCILVAARQSDDYGFRVYCLGYDDGTVSAGNTRSSFSLAKAMRGPEFMTAIIVGDLV